MRGRSGAIVLAVVLGGCASIKAGRIHELPIPKDVARGNPIWSSQSVLVRRFEDARPTEHSRNLPTAYLVPINLIHTGARTQYVEQGGYRLGDTRYLGWLPVELPMLLQASLPGDNAMCTEDLPDASAIPRWDYVVEGRLITTKLTQHFMFLLAFVSWAGPPNSVNVLEFEYELSVYAAGSPDAPIMRKTYAYKERRSEGIWFHRDSAEWLKRDSLKQTLRASAKDIVREVTLHRARRNPGP